MPAFPTVQLKTVIPRRTGLCRDHNKDNSQRVFKTYCRYCKSQVLPVTYVSNRYVFRYSQTRFIRNHLTIWWLILLGKYAYFGLDFCINIVHNPLWALQERQVLMICRQRDKAVWKSARMTSAQATDDVGSVIEPTSSRPIFKRLYLIIYKTLALTFSVQLKEC